MPNSIDRARDELFSHIRRCGVLEAEADQRGEWFDDTIQYIGERYPELSPSELSDLRTIGERYCAPPIPHGGGKDESEAEATTPEADEDVVVEVESVAPTAAEPVEVTPVEVEPVAVESAAVEPAAVEPAAVEPAAVEPAAVEPAAVEPAAVEPAAVEDEVVDTGEVSAA